MKERMKDLYQGGSITASGLLKALHHVALLIAL